MTTIITPNIYPPLQRLDQLSTLIGNTPLYEITKIWQGEKVKIFAKLEWKQFGGSVKSRPAFNIIKTAIDQGLLGSGQQLLDATSGNTGIAYAHIGAALGIPVTLCLPENASEERKLILQALGVNIIYTSKFEGTDGAQQKAKEIHENNPGKYFYANQYANEANWMAHYKGTGNEIWHQTSGKVTHFIAGLGTTGTFTGVGRRLKSFNKSIQLVSLQPNNPMHGLEGWKHLETAIVPKIYDDQLADQNQEVDTLQAFDLVKRIAQEEGLLVSPSAAANLLGAIELAKKLKEGVIVTTLADDASKYKEVYQKIFNS